MSLNFNTLTKKEQRNIFETCYSFSHFQRWGLYPYLELEDRYMGDASNTTFKLFVQAMRVKARGRLPAFAGSKYYLLEPYLS